MRPDELFSIPAERATLGAVLADNQLMSLVAEVVQPADFYEVKHQQIFTAMLRLTRRGGAVDHITTSDELKIMGPTLLAEVGGPAYLMSLDQGVPLTHNAVQYAETVRSLAQRRRAVAVLREAEQEAKQLGIPLEQALAMAAGKLAKVGAQRQGLVNGRVLLESVLAKSDAAQVEKRSARLLRTNIRAWDEYFGGVPLGELTVVAANPAVGKTSLLAAQAEAMVGGGEAAPGVAVSYHSLEDSGEAIFRRYLAAYSNLAIRQIFEPGLTPEQLDARGRGAEAVFHRVANLWVDDEQGQDVHSVARKIRYAHAIHGIRVAFVDHLLEMVGYEDDRRQDERVGEILRVLRVVARELGIAVVLAVHLRRGKDESVDYRFIKPGLQMIAGAEHVARMARLAVGLWFAKPLPEPKAPKPIAKPRIPKKATREEEEAILEEWQQKCRGQEHEYNRALARWREDAENKSNSIVCTALKVTEGQQLQDIMLSRIVHAGLVDRFK
jgi:replicative DNA helicase